MSGRSHPASRHGLVLVGGAVAIVCIVASAVGLVLVRWEVAAVGKEAGESFPGDRVEALIRLACSPSHDLALRDRAVWALGRLRDPRAVPALQTLRTGEPCDHSRWVCQREVEKAIAACRNRSSANPARILLERLEAWMRRGAHERTCPTAPARPVGEHESSLLENGGVVGCGRNFIS